MSLRAIFLDRDGVINRAEIRDGKGYPPARLEDVEIFPGIVGQLGRLKASGFLLVVVTNQPDVARGKTPKSTVDSINSLIAKEIPSIDRILVCYHDNGDNCSCRKPKPGMLLQAAADHGIDLSRSYMIGDRWSDVEAGRAAGTKTVFIDYGYAERQPTNFDHRVLSTSEALQLIESELQDEKD